MNNSLIKPLVSNKNFKIIQTNTKNVKKFNASTTNYQVIFQDVPTEFVDSLFYMNEIMQLLVKSIVSQTDKRDKIKITIDHPVLSEIIELPFVFAGDLTSSMIMSEISKVVQSNKILTLDNNIIFHTLIVRYFSGGGPAKRLDDFLYKKKTIIRIKAHKENKLCALRAIIVGKAICDKNPLYENIRDSRNVYQNDTALAIAERLNFNINVEMGVNEIHQIEEYLKDYQIIVFNNELMNEIMYKGCEKEKKIFLFYHDHHFDVIRSLPAFYGKENYCFQCMKPYKTFINHPCNNVCKKCKVKTCVKKAFKKCESCFVLCNSEVCHFNHLKNVCNRNKKCVTCGAFQTFNHNCGMWCNFCKKPIESDHKCYILKEQNDKEINFRGYIFFDYECMQVNDSSHMPNLIIATRLCVDCIDKKNTCDKILCQTFVFKSNDDFGNWLFNTKNKFFIAIAHNMKGYDGFFIMDFIIKNLLPTDNVPEILLNGSKLLVIKFMSVKIIDSINFIPMALAKMPKTFGLAELKKGYFPHFFNTPDNQNYVGDYPAPTFYGAEFMSVDENVKFLKWHAEQNLKVFDFQKELEEYCKSDVDILQKSCLKFRQLFMLITVTDDCVEGIDPFINSLTMPSVCHEVYRRQFMPVDSIALIPAFGYQNQEATSYKAIIWLKYISITNNINILHSRNGGEKKIGNYKLDGWNIETDTAYEFHGCVFHGCPKCYNHLTFNALKNELMSQTYLKHVKRIDEIRKNVSSLVEIWECEYNILAETNPDLKQLIIQESNIKPPLNPRDALAGGRTNAIILHYEGDADYVDFTSLYPYVQKYGQFPIGHPQIITENFSEIENYFGLIYCRILPPRKLYHPVLPYHANGKLLFPLCAACAHSSQHECSHSNDERCLEGTWVSLEIKVAIENGYKIDKIFEIWHWRTVEQYNTITKEGGLFTQYVNRMLKIKQEASGYPAWVQSEEDKIRYINEYNQREGILLEKNNITSNPGLKALSKLLLNSQWGRYAMQTLKTVCKFVKNYQELFDYFNNKQYEVKNVLFPTEEIAMLLYQDSKEMHWGSNQTNVAIAAFVTSQARLKLYSEMKLLGERVMYVDTDSIIFKRDRNLYSPQLGDYLGEFTNEIDPTEGSHIVEFVSAGPKNYSYKLNTGITHSKVKGISLNFSASKKIDFNQIKSLVCNLSEEKILVTQKTIVRDKNDWSLCTKTTDKIYRMVYDKRVIREDLSTIPYGY